MHLSYRISFLWEQIHRRHLFDRHLGPNIGFFFDHGHQFYLYRHRQTGFLYTYRLVLRLVLRLAFM